MTSHQSKCSPTFPGAFPHYFPYCKKTSLGGKPICCAGTPNQFYLHELNLSLNHTWQSACALYLRPALESSIPVAPSQQLQLHLLSNCSFSHFKNVKIEKRFRLDQTKGMFGPASLFLLWSTTYHWEVYKQETRAKLTAAEDLRFQNSCVNKLIGQQSKYIWTWGSQHQKVWELLHYRTKQEVLPKLRLHPTYTQ